MWQQPLAETGYAAEGAFSLVSLLAPKVRAHIVLTGDPDDLDIFSSQMQAEPPVGNKLAQTSASWLSGGCYLSAPDHASGCPELRSASANQPLGPLGPAKSALPSTRWSGPPPRGCDQIPDVHVTEAVTVCNRGCNRMRPTHCRWRRSSTEDSHSRRLGRNPTGSRWGGGDPNPNPTQTQTQTQTQTLNPTPSLTSSLTSTLTLSR